MTTFGMSAPLPGNDFLGRIALLSDAAGITAEAAARFIHAGRSVELVTSIASRLCPHRPAETNDELTSLLQAAKAYEAPASLDTLRAALYRAMHLCRNARQSDDPPLPFVPGETCALYYVEHLVLLTTRLGYPPVTIARLLYTGRYAALVEALSMDNRLRTCEHNIRELNALSAVAEDFILPERFLHDPDLLVSTVERISGR